MIATQDTLKRLEANQREVDKAIDALRTAARSHGYLVKEISGRLVHICYSTGNPFYTVRIARRPRSRMLRLYYDIGECYVLNADKAMVKIIDRTPK